MTKAPKRLAGRQRQRSRTDAVRASIALLFMAAGCGPRSPVVVAVAFENTWRVGSEMLTGPETSLLEKTALQTLRSAYAGFNVQIVEAPSAQRVIRVEDTPYGRPYFGAAGLTYPASTSSSVRFDVLANALLAAAQCEDLIPCSTSRTDLVSALGRAVGATAAHELGHQAGLGGFAIDSRCDDCFDGRSTRYRHFFGTKHWSSQALAVMRRVLPKS